MPTRPAVIFSLPDELLVAIASAGQEGSDPATYQIRWRASDFPEWTLSHVSRQFRDIVINAPSLWTRIETGLDRDRSIAGDRSVQVMKLYLERSRECALSVTFTQWYWSAVQKDVADRLYHIIPHLARVSRLTIGLKGDDIQTKELLAPFLELSAPNLQRLDIFHWQHGGIMQELAHVVDVFSSAPRLTSLRMVGAILGLPVPSWVASLTHLELRKADSSLPEQPPQSSEFLAAIAPQCLSLVHLHVELRSVLPSGQFHIPSLQTLYLGIWPSVNGDESDRLYLSQMLDLFDTPAVTTLTVFGTHGDQLFQLFSSAGLPRATFPALTSLTFVRDFCVCEKYPLPAAPAFLPPLRLFPALTSLSLINQCFTANLVKDILGSPWPLLRTLALAPLCPPYPTSELYAVPGVYAALGDAVRLKPGGAEALPMLLLSDPLLDLMEKGDAVERAVDMDVFDPSELLALNKFET
ncbi:hypothetical protein C8R46DRAFT_344460 [Mycena filopes]|nr:hypothetical protein C8R46DRAFT_344460 [Mycena filopes]